ncbi:MAG: hypothetical protein ABL893_20370, partial [Hyphomicrobium sp.]
MSGPEKVGLLLLALGKERADQLLKRFDAEELNAIMRSSEAMGTVSTPQLEDVVFEYEPHELGLKDEDAAKLREIHQLRPLETGQPWGIFFVNFEKKSLPIVILRRVLNALV